MMRTIKWSTFAYAIGVLLLLLFAASLVVVYALPRSNSFVKKVVEKSPYPVVVIGYRDGVSFRTLAQNMASIKRFYESQDFSQVGLRVDFSTSDGQQRFKVREKEVLNKMIEDEAIMALARDRGITVTHDEVEQGVQRKLDEYGSGDEVKKNLDRLYGWTLVDFENKVVLPSLYEGKLQASFQKEVDTTSQAKGKIQSAEAALRAGKEFSDVAKQFSEGQTAGAGGELGWLTLDDLAPELRKPVATQKVGTPSNIIESDLGFHIILVEEIKKENDKQLYRVKQIFAKKKMFADWLTEKMKTLSVWVLSPEYRWNAEEARVDFRSGELQNFEKELYKKTSGDAMFFF